MAVTFLLLMHRTFNGPEHLAGFCNNGASAAEFEVVKRAAVDQLLKG